MAAPSFPATRPGTPRLPLGLLLLIGLAGCHRQHSPVSEPQAPAIPHLLVYAPNPTQSPPVELDASKSGATPTAAYPSLRAACDLVQQAMGDWLRARVKRTDSVGFENEFVGAHRTGCELKATGSFTSVRTDTSASRTNEGDLVDALGTAGWVEIPRYSADGPDGSISGMRSRETVCIFAWSWDGGDDSDSTYVPSDYWELVTRCAPQEPGDSV
jgi:hypothetical protein